MRLGFISGSNGARANERRLQAPADTLQRTGSPYAGWREPVVFSGLSPDGRLDDRTCRPPVLRWLLPVLRVQEQAHLPIPSG